MIQTQLLRLDPPYQIISAGGQVGIQVATLIVTEDKSSTPGEYLIDTHSHPVVCYGLKDGMVEELKYGSSFPDVVDERNQRLQPEGAVWNKVEVSDIRVLGIAGAANYPVSLETFIYLVPSSTSHMPYSRVWDENSLAKMYDLMFGFKRVKLNCQKMKWKNSQEYDHRHKKLHLELDTSDKNNPLVHVIIMSEDPYDPFTSEIGFKCRLYDADSSIDACANIIINIVSVLRNWFIEGHIDDKFKYWHYGESQDLEKDMEELKNRINQELGF